MPTVLALETLHKRNATSDKVYVAAVVQQDGGGYLFSVRWGRRGANLQRKDYFYSTVTSARAAWRRKVDDQLGEHYQPVDWRVASFGMATAVAALGDSTGLHGSSAPAAVTQKSEPPKDPTAPGTLGEAIWKLAQKGLRIAAISNQLNGITTNTIAGMLDQIVPVERKKWQQAGMPPHDAIMAGAPGLAPCRICAEPAMSKQHLGWMKANPHTYAESPVKNGVQAVHCYCGHHRLHSIHSVGAATPKPKPPVAVPIVVPLTPGMPAPASTSALAALSDDDLDAMGGATPVDLDDEAPEQPEPEYVPPGPIVLPQRRRERAPRGMR